VIAAALVGAILVTTVPPDDQAQADAYFEAYVIEHYRPIQSQAPYCTVEPDPSIRSMVASCEASVDGDVVHLDGYQDPDSGEWVWEDAAGVPTPTQPPPAAPAGTGFPDTELGRAAQACISGNPVDFEERFFRFYDDGLSVLVVTQAEFLEEVHADECMVLAMGLPEWVGHASFVGVLTFGDWSVMRGASGVPNIPGTGGLWIMDNEVAPDS
jgi:hypothetical protein